MRENIRMEEINSDKDKIDLRYTLKKASGYWKIFLISIVIALIFSFVYLKLATYNYEVSSTILINDEDNDGGSTSQISVFQDLGLFVGPKTSLDTEIGVLKSKTLIERVVKDLGLNISYFIKKDFVSREIYKNQLPYQIHFILNDQGISNLNSTFTIRSKSNSEYDLLDSNGTKIKSGVFGEKIPWQFGDVIITPNQLNQKEQQDISIKISPLEEVAIALKKRIEITQDNPKSNLLILKLQDPIKLKAREILDSLVSYYNEDAVNYKNLIAKNTTEFLNSRIADVAVELTGLDQGVETYKSQNKLSNIEYQSNITLASNASLSKQIVELNSQIKLVEYLIEYMKTNTNDIIPDNLGILDANVNRNTITYNNLLLDRNRFSKGANTQNPVIVNLDTQIKSLRESIDRGLLNQKSSLVISLNEARRQESKLNSQLTSAPKKEKELNIINRQQNIIETLYLYLLQKREENSISSAITVPYAIIIDKAYGSAVPVAPRKVIVLLTSLLLGFLVPALFLVLRGLLDNKIHSTEDVKSIIKTNLIGEIPKTKLKDKFIAFGNAKNINVTESFRLLRTNITHLLNGNNKKSKRIFVTSTTSEEGKTFIASNLATAFSLLDKKVLLIEANVRSPKVETYLNLKSEKGLFHFLTDNSVKILDVINHYDKHNFDVIEAGKSNEHSAELLSSGRFEEILNYGSNNYEYVIIEVPSVNVDSDTLRLAHYADLFLYVVRASYLSERMLDVPKKLIENKRLPNINILINDLDYKKLGYNNPKAGVKKSFWKKF